MSKLNLEALKEKAGAITSLELLESISGGTDNACHDSFDSAMKMDASNSKNSLGSQIAGWIMSWF
ncbi:hypothetical protein [Flavobacterium tructae]|uniref:hypothetical protein n=1 Tax=Flavobacterium tructae TaxID=1114873 RepID=UPI0035A8985B